jgi:regulator of cell morphogenesis and NO signaling
METYINHSPEIDSSTVAQLAVAHPGALAVFTKYNIDYCCGGHRSLQEACYRIGLDPEKVRKEIYESSAETNEPLRFETWRSGFLADFIVQNHHAFVKRAIPELEALLDKVRERHGNDVVELLKIRACFFEVAEELKRHMDKEELVLFPAIKRLEAQQGLNHPMERTILAPIAIMEDEHQAAGDLIKEIRSLSKNYTPPEFACPTFRITFQKLKEFDDDLMKHIHLENNILFQRFKK